MNLDMIRPKNETEVSLLPIFQNCETLIKQTHKKDQETKASLNLGLNCNWILGFTSLEVKCSLFNILEGKNNIGLDTHHADDEFP